MIGLKIAATGIIVFAMLRLLDGTAKEELTDGWYIVYAAVGVLSMLSVAGGLIVACWSV